MSIEERLDRIEALLTRLAGAYAHPDTRSPSASESMTGEGSEEPVRKKGTCDAPSSSDTHHKVPSATFEVLPATS